MTIADCCQNSVRPLAGSSRPRNSAGAVHSRYPAKLVSRITGLTSSKHPVLKLTLVLVWFGSHL